MGDRPCVENMEKLNGKRILVTGGTGFIGSHIVEKLIALGAHVVVVDITCPDVSYISRQKLAEKAELKLIDITNSSGINNLFSLVKPEYVFHLAAEAIVDNSYNNPYKTFNTNIMGTVSILEAARKLGTIKGIIVASSDKAYGKTKSAYTEDSPLKGDHPYDVSKSATDLIAQTYYKTYGLPVVVTRFGNVYGQGDLHMDRIIPGICESVIKKKPLLIRSDGKYIRDYIYVKDVAEGYLFLLSVLDKVQGEAFNFSSRDTYSVMELIMKAEKILGEKIEYKILNIAKNEIPYQHLDNTKIKKLGWTTNFTLDTALQQTLMWYKVVV